MKVCTKENPMPGNSSQKWEHPDAFQFGVSGCGDNSAIAFMLCPHCNYDFMARNIEVPKGAQIQ